MSPSMNSPFDSMRFSAFGSPSDPPVSVAAMSALESEKAATARSFPLSVPPMYATSHMNPMVNPMKMRSDPLTPPNNGPINFLTSSMSSLYPSAASSLLSSLSAHSHHLSPSQTTHANQYLHQSACGTYLPTPPGYHFSPVTSHQSVNSQLNDFRSHSFAAYLMGLKSEEHRMSSLPKLSPPPIV